MSTFFQRQQAAKWQERMLKFHRIYNAGWQVRHHMYQRNAEMRLYAINQFWRVMMQEAAKCDDPEALLYAVADAITSNPLGLPWEG